MRSPIKSIQHLGFPWATLDPFLFCVHHKDDYPKGKEDLTPDASLQGRQIGQDFTIKDGWRMYHGQRIPGFPYHPHRGFETVTITETGLIDHSDSLGAAGRFGNGDVQWMTAGKGVLHSEMFPMLNQDSGNPLEFFQLWLNLPSDKKLVDPNFGMIWANDVPSIKIEDTNGKTTSIRIMAGAYADLTAPSVAPNSWAAEAQNGVRIMTVEIEEGGDWMLPVVDTGYNRMLYFYRGEELQIAEQNIPVERAVQLDPSAAVNVKAIGGPAKLLILEGKPIGEPVAQQGPFVMNTQEEIQQAFADYRRTQFGGWPWPLQEQVHGKEKGRFALYADGYEEVML